MGVQQGASICADLHLQTSRQQKLDGDINPTEVKEFVLDIPGFG